MAQVVSKSLQIGSVAVEPLKIAEKPTQSGTRPMPWDGTVAMLKDATDPTTAGGTLWQKELSLGRGSLRPRSNLDHITLKNITLTGWLRRYGFVSAGGPSNKATRGRARAKSNTSEYSHNQMQGGRYGNLMVPISRYGEFLFVMSVQLLNQAMNVEIPKPITRRFMEGRRWEPGASEKRTERFRFFMDLDFEQPDPVPLVYDPEHPESNGGGTDTMYLEDCLRVIQQTIGLFFPHADRERGRNPRQCLVTASETKTTASGAVKSGFHIIWPQLIVTAQQAIVIREEVVNRLLLKFRIRSGPYNAWGDVVDINVYTQTGLRMVGSWKWKPCNTCRSAKKPRFINTPEGKVLANDPLNPNTPRDEIDEEDDRRGCDNDACDFGKVFEGRPYWVVAVWDHACQPMFEEMENMIIGPPRANYEDHAALHRMYYTMLRSSIRVEPSDEDMATLPQFKRPTWLTTPVPTPMQINLQRARTVAQQSRATKDGCVDMTRVKMDSTDHLQVPGRQSRNILLDPAKHKRLYDLLENFIQRGVSYLPEPNNLPYKEKGALMIYGIYYKQLTERQKRPNLWFVSVRGYASGFCHNLGRSHRSQNIYFVINKHGLWQECYCQHDTTEGRLSGKPCRLYKSPVTKLTQELRHMLFFSEALAGLNSEHSGNDERKELAGKPESVVQEVKRVEQLQSSLKPAVPQKRTVYEAASKDEIRQMMMRRQRPRKKTKQTNKP